jgi:hypothetical protein
MKINGTEAWEHVYEIINEDLFVAFTPNKADAERIVECSNTHDDLVAYLKMTLPAPCESVLSNKEVEFGRKILSKLKLTNP